MEHSHPRRGGQLGSAGRVPACACGSVRPAPAAGGLQAAQTVCAHSARRRAGSCAPAAATALPPPAAHPHGAGRAGPRPGRPWPGPAPPRPGGHPALLPRRAAATPAGLPRVQPSLAGPREHGPFPSPRSAARPGPMSRGGKPLPAPGAPDLVLGSECSVVGPLCAVYCRNLVLSSLRPHSSGKPNACHYNRCQQNKD